MRSAAQLAILAILGAVIATSAPTPASAAAPTEDVVVGHLEEFADIERAHDIAGPVRLRRGSGWTQVRMNARGLHADTTYTAHLHVQACSDFDAGGHYKDKANGVVEPPNELWIEISTNRAGNGHGVSSASWRVRDGFRSVVIHDTDGKKIACADLPVGDPPLDDPALDDPGTPPGVAGGAGRPTSR